MKTQNNSNETATAQAVVSLRHHQFVGRLNELVLAIRDKAAAQFIYNETRNVPAGIVQPDDSIESAIRHGVAAAINKTGQWDTDNAIAFAIGILEDANCHAEVAAIGKVGAA